MADKVDIKTLLAGVVLVKAGKIVDGEPTDDNYSVYPAKGSPLAVIPGHEVVKALKAAYPKAVFTWLATPIARSEPKSEPKK